jgi:SAM-dependent methyltransferase
MSEWFEDWFDSPYYHMLYKYRDEEEAEGFIDRLIGRLAPPPQARILDLACGKGRYSMHLAKKGFAVTGIDLSPKSIAFAREFEADGLSFHTHDMRTLFSTNYFDLTVNFFTSFGYFESDEEDIKVLENVHSCLKPDGLFVLDFFNSQYVLDQLIGSAEKKIDGITFQIRKQVKDKYVIKSIIFEDQGQEWKFQEKVRLFTFADFRRMFAQTGFEILDSYGNYALEPYQQNTSPRLILIAKAIK